jgi:predicted NBD/HSP70 family sugar kinase
MEGTSMPKGTGLLRAVNEKRVLNFLREHKTASRQEMAEALGLSKNTVSLIVDKLLRDGMVQETGLDTTGVGRPRKQLSLIPNAFHAIGILVQDTACEFVVTDYLGRVVESGIHPMNSTDSVDCLSQIAELCLSLEKEYPRLLGVGIAVPGLVDPIRGIVHYSSHVGWRDVPVVDVLGERLSVPVIVYNRVKAAALSPTQVIPEQASSTFYIRIDEGVGGAFVIRNKVMHGASWTAGEIGHLSVDPDGPRCSCGQRGCLESLVSLQVLRRQLCERIGVERGRTEWDRVFTEGWRAYGREFGDILHKAGEYVGTGVATIVNLFNPQCIVIDSPYGEIVEFRDALLAVAEQRALSFPFQHVHIQFMNSQFSSAIGAALGVILSESPQQI